MRLLLAPMEGLLDFVLRDVLTRVGGADRCVSEFIRVTGTLLPDKVFLRTMPELNNGSRTLAGVPVRAQLLGSDPDSMAANAANLARLGPEGIDLNFGCPAKVVNRHGGGAALLQDPEQIARVVGAVRAAVPAAMPVSAKMRLGFNDDAVAEDNALAIADAGADELVVHARTKAHGYKPPAYWERIAHIRAVLPAGGPVLIANGEIWTAAQAQRAAHPSPAAIGLALERMEQSVAGIVGPGSFQPLDAAIALIHRIIAVPAHADDVIFVVQRHLRAAEHHAEPAKGTNFTHRSLPPPDAC